ncbi:DUF1304 domain-containing protein [Deinococcus hopiensis]|uniref:Putative membrane protein n=1 Tax=Deinococcus hopiensis KR-140 TaxID=695939 RepID=A0A1W1VIT4_9DEIO|nr:DUF1304 domain-containing protein [Deinococcus hopiensis]SMB93295.1 putative membrane protein [Deinococcus hopiensis KR-140]
MMHILSMGLILLVALIHVYIVILEMFLWTHPRGRAAFGTTAEEAQTTRVLAANQGVYNGFLVAGLLWSLLAPAALAPPLKIFFLMCVIIAGLYGTATVSRRILFVQVIPAVLALLAVLLSR